jgi:hypothetical protein
MYWTDDWAFMLGCEMGFQGLCWTGAEGIKKFKADSRDIEQEKRDIEALFTSHKILQNFSDFPSHRIFRRMHEVLNIDKNKN